MMDFTSFGKLPRVPIESGVKRWQNMVKGCIMRVDRIEEIPQEKFTGHVLHFIQANGVKGKCYPPKPFLNHIKLHQKQGTEIYFYVKENAPEGDVDFDIRFAEKAAAGPAAEERMEG